MTPLEQHLKDYEVCLLIVVNDTIRGWTNEGHGSELAAARKTLADHITLCQTAHHHSQYELKTNGLP